jgi:peptide/nickel transport system permease protein
MLSYLGRRLLLLLPTAAVPLLLVFFMLRLAPGDPASILAGDQATPEQVAALRHELGLDASLWHQFVLFCKQIVTLQLGNSHFLAKPVMELIPPAAAVTLEVSMGALVLGLALGIALGCWAAFRQHHLDGGVARTLGILGISMPNFVMALVLILVLAVEFRLFLVGGWVPISKGLAPHLRTVGLPILTLALAEAGGVSRITRGAVLDVLREPYVTTARAQGIKEGRISVVYVLRVAGVQILTVAGLLTAGLLSGSAVIENIFGLPGMGRLLFEAVQRRDYQLVQGVVLFTGLFIIVINLVVDLLYAVIDPRVRLGAQEK